MNGFKITITNFNQAITLPAGTYTYSCNGVKPVGTSITFMVGSQSFVIDNLLAGVFQAGFKKTFTIESEASAFYPARTVGDIIYEPQLETGTVATDPGPNPLDIDEAIESAGLEITSETARLYAKKADVSSEILVMADSINSNVSDLNGRVSTVEQTASSINLNVESLEENLLSTGINITDKKVEVTTDTFFLKGNNGVPYVIFDSVNGVPIMRAEHIDARSITSKIVKTANTGKRVEVDGSGLNIFNIFGNRQIEFGINANGDSVMKYYDNSGTLLYDLGPEGLTKTQSRSEAWLLISNMTQLATLPGDIGSSFDKNLIKNTKTATPATLYKYVSQINMGVNLDTENDGRLFTSPTIGIGYRASGVFTDIRTLAYAYRGAYTTGQASGLPFMHPSNEIVHYDYTIFYAEVPYFTGGIIYDPLSYRYYWNEETAEQ